MVDKRNRDISARILNLIADNEMTAYQAMKQLNLTSAVFYNCMNSKRSWSIENLIKISDRFHVTLDYLIKGHPEQKFKTEFLREEYQRLNGKVEELSRYVNSASDILLKVADKSVEYGKKKK